MLVDEIPMFLLLKHHFQVSHLEVKWQQGPQQFPAEGGAVGKRYAEKVKQKSPTVMARNTSYKY